MPSKLIVPGVGDVEVPHVGEKKNHPIPTVTVKDPAGNEHVLPVVATCAIAPEVCEQIARAVLDLINKAAVAPEEVQ